MRVLEEAVGRGIIVICVVLLSCIASPALCALDGWTVGGNGTIYHTPDGGATWTQQSTNTAQSLLSISMADSKHGVVGGVGRILRTSDGGATWASQSFGSASFPGIVDVDGLNVWAVGSGGAVLHSTDGGNNWLAQGGTTSKTLYGVDFINAQNGW